MLGDGGNRPVKKKTTSKNLKDKKKSAAENRQKKKVREKLGSAMRLDNIEEDDKEENSSDDGNPGDKYDPLSRNKEGGLSINKKTML